MTGERDAGYHTWLLVEVEGPQLPHLGESALHGGYMSQIKMLEQIPHHKLREGHVPEHGAPWSEIVPFASTFNAYEQHQWLDLSAIAADAQAKGLSTLTLTHLRAALFFEYRRYNHFGSNPEPPQMVQLHSLVDEIRRRIQLGEHRRGQEA